MPETWRSNATGQTRPGGNTSEGPGAARRSPGSAEGRRPGRISSRGALPARRPSRLSGRALQPPVHCSVRVFPALRCPRPAPCLHGQPGRPSATERRPPGGWTAPQDAWRAVAVGQGRVAGSPASRSGPAAGTRGDRGLPESDTKDPARPPTVPLGQGWGVAALSPRP